MDDFLKEALEIVKAQASVRTMSEEEIISMVKNLSSGLRPSVNTSDTSETEAEATPCFQGDPKKSIKEKTVNCLECGKTFKIITKKHLALHGLTAETYREKWGFKKGTPLACKELQRMRRKKMVDMKLWEKRKRVVEES